MTDGRPLVFDERPDFASQHRQLELLIGSLALYEGCPTDDENLLILLESLAAYTKMHFMMEEQYMRARGFPGLAAHQEAHRLLLAEVESYRRSLTVEKVALTRDQTSYLRGWLADHVSTLDAEYDEYVMRDLLPQPFEKP